MRFSVSRSCFLFPLLAALFCISVLGGCQSTGSYYSPWTRYLPTQSSAPLKEGEQIVEPDISWQQPGQAQVTSASAKTAADNMKFSLESLEWQKDEDSIVEMEGPPPGAQQQDGFIHAPPGTVLSKASSYEERHAGILPPRGMAAAPAPASRKIPVAILLPLSGPSAGLGKAMLQAAQLALFDVGTENFELLPRDTKGTPRGAQDAAQSAVLAGAQLIIGPLFSDSLKAVRPVARRAGIPVISFSTDWTLAGNGTYVMGFMPFAQVARVVSYARSKGYPRIGVVAPRTEYGDVVVRTLHYNLGRDGSRIAEILRYPADTADMTDLIRAFSKFDAREENLKMTQAALKENPAPEAQAELQRLETQDTLGDLPYDALLLPIGGDHLKQVATLLSYYDVDVKYLGTGLWDDENLLRENTLYGAWFAAPSPGLRKGFEDRYTATFRKAPPRLATLAYDATALAVTLSRQYAASRQGGQTLYSRERLTNPRGFAGIDGIFRFRQDGLIERGLAVLEVRKSGFRVIDPAPTAFRVGSGY